MYGSLARNASPGSIDSSGKRCRIADTSRKVDPRCAGALVINDSARPLASQIAVEQSARSLMLGEKAVRTRLAAISCVAASNALAMISSWACAMVLSLSRLQQQIQKLVDTHDEIP